MVEKQDVVERMKKIANDVIERMKKIPEYTAHPQAWYESHVIDPLKDLIKEMERGEETLKEKPLNLQEVLYQFARNAGEGMEDAKKFSLETTCLEKAKVRAGELAFRSVAESSLRRINESGCVLSGEALCEFNHTIIKAYTEGTKLAYASFLWELGYLISALKFSTDSTFDRNHPAYAIRRNMIGSIEVRILDILKKE